MKEIKIRPAVPEDGETIIEIMTIAHEAMADQDAYITDDLSYIKRHLQDEGFGLMAEVEGVPAGFFVVCFPEKTGDNLGYHLNFTEEQLMKTAIMDTAAVLPEYQGMGLMGRMFSAAVEMTEGEYPYLLGTVHPDNTPSRRNFEKNGFVPMKTIVKPSGSLRLLMGRFKETP